MQEKQRISAKMEASVPPFHEWTEDSPLKLDLAPAASRVITLSGLPPNEPVLINSKRRIIDDSGTLRLMPSGDDSAVVISRLTQVAQPTVESQAIVTQMTCQQRLVIDGGCLTNTSLSVRHHTEFDLSLKLPPEADVLQCLVAGKPVSNIIDNDTLKLHLKLEDRQSDITKVDISFFSKLAPFATSTGRLPLQTPASTLFHENLEWSIELPSGLTLASLNTNTEAAQKVQGMNRISLKRALWRNDPPKAEIFYQPENP